MFEVPEQNLRIWLTDQQIVEAEESVKDKHHVAYEYIDYLTRHGFGWASDKDFNYLQAIHPITGDKLDIISDNLIMDKDTLRHELINFRLR